MSVRVSDYFRDLDLLIFTDGCESKTVDVNQAVKAIVHKRVKAGTVKFTEKTMYIKDTSGKELRVRYDINKLNAKTADIIRKQIAEGKGKTKGNSKGIHEKERIKLRKQLEKEMSARDIERKRENEAKEQRRAELEAKRNRTIHFINTVGNLKYRGSEEENENNVTQSVLKGSGKIQGEGSIRYKGVTYKNINELAKKYGKTGAVVRRALAEGRSLDDALGLLGSSIYKDSEEASKILKSSAKHMGADIGYNERTDRKNIYNIEDKRYIDDTTQELIEKITRGSKEDRW